MTYSKDNQIRKYVKRYGFMSFTKNFGSKYGKKSKQSKGISASKTIKHLNLIQVNMIKY